MSSKSELSINISLRGSSTTSPQQDATPDKNLSETEKMLNGDLYYSFTPELMAGRARCAAACHAFNQAINATRFEKVKLMNKIFRLPPPTEPEAKADPNLSNYPWIEPPFRADYGTNTYISPSTFINFSCTILDTCSVTIGPRVLIGPNVSFYSATHPIDPRVRNGSEGPELGKPIVVEEDVWIGGSVIILPGLTIGRGAVIGAGSVVTKDVAEFTVVAGNPAKVIKKIDVTGELPELPPRPTGEDLEQGRGILLGGVEPEEGGVPPSH